jgi:hypothetical protein
VPKPQSFATLLKPAEDAVFSRQESELMTELRKRSLSFEVAPVVWRRLGRGLSDWQRPAISKTLQLDWKLMGAIPYVNLNSAETRQLMQTLADPKAVAAFNESVASKKKRSRSDAKAVRFYTTRIVNAGEGLPWLRNRQPKGMALVDGTLRLYTASMDRCLARVEDDRDYLARCFLDAHAIQRLDNLVVTDSDPHKGGQRVAFLDLSFRSGKKSLKRRVVYKPSDVEIDYRIVGKNTDAITRLFTEKQAEGIFPEPHESFLEMLDRLQLNAINQRLTNEWSEDPPTRQALQSLLTSPTYVILPRNPGSRMKASSKASPLPIGQSYGYLEYLPFQPKAPTLGYVMPNVARPALEAYAANRKRWQTDPFATAGASDWILDQPEKAKPAFRLWGRLMSVACVLLQTDLHHQNQRLRGLKPHIIDLENCLIKSCPLPGGQSGTMMPEALLKFAAAAGPGLPQEGTSNQLYLRRGRSAAWLSILDAANALQVKEGMREALVAMTASREDIAHWVQASGLANVVVRHVAQPTGNLLTALGEFFSAQLKPENAGKDTDALLGELLEVRREDAEQFWKRAKSDYIKDDNPMYGLEIAAYNGRDFKDRSIPAYYRRAGSLDLLTWRGEVVTYHEKQGDTKDMVFAHYH